MKIGVLGTGMVGTAIATRLVELGHDVMIGSRDGKSEAATSWLAEQKGTASTGSFAEAARHGEVVVLAVRGDVALAAVAAAGPGRLAGKVLLNISNPLDFSQGFPPRMIPELSNTTSLSEAVQAAAPEARVVGSLNTMNASLMVNPAALDGPHDVFLCGDDDEAKQTVSGLLNEFGWSAPIDLGPLRAARGTEGMMPFWLALFARLGHANFNYHLDIGDRP